MRYEKATVERRIYFLKSIKTEQPKADLLVMYQGEGWSRNMLFADVTAIGPDKRKEGARHFYSMPEKRRKVELRKYERMMKNEDFAKDRISSSGLRATIERRIAIAEYILNDCRRIIPGPQEVADVVGCSNATVCRDFFLFDITHSGGGQWKCNRGKKLASTLTKLQKEMMQVIAKE